MEWIIIEEEYSAFSPIVQKEPSLFKSLSVKSTRLQTVGIVSVAVKVRTFVPLADAGALNTTFVSSVIEAIVIVPVMPVPLTVIPTPNLDESATVRAVDELAVVHDCFMVAFNTQSAPSSPESSEEMRSCLLLFLSFEA